MVEVFRTCPDRPWGPPSLLCNGYRVFPGGKERPGRDADPSPRSSAVVKKEYSYISTPPIGCTVCTEPQCLYCTRLHTTFTFYLNGISVSNVITSTKSSFTFFVFCSCTFILNRQRNPGTAHCNPLKLKVECNTWCLPLYSIAYCVYVMQHIYTHVLGVIPNSSCVSAFVILSSMIFI